MVDNQPPNSARFRSASGPVLADAAPTVGYPRQADRRCYTEGAFSAGSSGAQIWRILAGAASLGEVVRALLRAPGPGVIL